MRSIVETRGQPPAAHPLETSVFPEGRQLHHQPLGTHGTRPIPTTDLTDRLDDLEIISIHLKQQQPDPEVRLIKGPSTCSSSHDLTHTLGVGPDPSSTTTKANVLQAAAGLRVSVATEPKIRPLMRMCCKPLISDQIQRQVCNIFRREEVSSQF
ncbi:hypothetical protein EYF80_060294 [Liparis tanakae]|uniref:Uncharacterized protein n=1 Tax=Liparis tanakae TaxID=230148 RepID=A0A4Z2EKS8_9TELE|nr:hypothetical protein EYF80_060294 [Liparis tanakae]